MRTLAEENFLRWAERNGLGLDERYPDSAVLTFRPNSGHDRFWAVPPKPERRPYFIASLLELMGDWRSCYAWRHLGSWPDTVDQRRLNDVIELRILRGLGLPLGTADIVEFSHDEFDTLITLILSTTIFGWSVGEDLYVVPDHARYILQTDHHDVIHISFRTSEEVDRWVSVMAERGFSLPDEVPDETFKRPGWMQSLTRRWSR
jgi:hypothetical protein